MLIIGIGHKKHSGKDTLAEFIAEELDRCSIIVPHSILRFADQLKIEVTNVCRVPLFELEENKDVFRPMLQWWGTEFRRKYQGNDNYWVEKLAKRIEKSEHKSAVYLVTDVRFPNEFEWVKSKGGKLIKIERPGTSTDNHASETALDGYTGWDMIVQNDGSKEQLLHKAKGIVNSLIIPNL